MTYLWIALGIVGGLIVVPIIIGMLLPERYVGQVEVIFPNPLDDVWTALADFESHPMTGKMMKGIEKLPDENGSATWVENMGHGEKITVKTVESEKPARLVREMSSAGCPMTSRWEYDLAPVDAACQVTLSGETRTPRQCRRHWANA